MVASDQRWLIFNKISQVLLLSHPARTTLIGRELHSLEIFSGCCCRQYSLWHKRAGVSTFSDLSVLDMEWTSLVRSRMLGNRFKLDSFLFPQHQSSFPSSGVECWVWPQLQVKALKAHSICCLQWSWKTWLVQFVLLLMLSVAMVS